MKRSEMVEIITNILAPYLNFAWHPAEEVLTAIEQAGMLPPFVPDDSSREHSSACPCLSCLNTIKIFGCKWEPEGFPVHDCEVIKADNWEFVDSPQCPYCHKKLGESK